MSGIKINTHQYSYQQQGGFYSGNGVVYNGNGQVMGAAAVNRVANIGGVGGIGGIGFGGGYLPAVQQNQGGGGFLGDVFRTAANYGTAMAGIGYGANQTTYAANGVGGAIGAIRGIFHRANGDTNQAAIYENQTGIVRDQSQRAREQGGYGVQGGDDYRTPGIVPEGRGAYNNGANNNNPGNYGRSQNAPSAPQLSQNDINQFNKLQDEKRESQAATKHADDVAKTAWADGELSNSDKRKIHRAERKEKHEQEDVREAEARVNPGILNAQKDQAAQEITAEKRREEQVKTEKPTIAFEDAVLAMNKATTPEAKVAAAKVAVGALSNFAENGHHEIQLQPQNLAVGIQEYIATHSPKNGVHPLLLVRTQEDLINEMSKVYEGMGKGKAVTVDLSGAEPVIVTAAPAQAADASKTQGAGTPKLDLSNPEKVFSDQIIAANKATNEADRMAALKPAEEALNKINEKLTARVIEYMTKHSGGVPEKASDVLTEKELKSMDPILQEKLGKANQDDFKRWMSDDKALMLDASAALKDKGVGTVITKDEITHMREAKANGKLNKVDGAAVSGAGSLVYSNHDITVDLNTYKHRGVTGNQAVADFQKQAEKFGFSTDAKGVADHKVDGVAGDVTKATEKAILEALAAKDITVPKDYVKGNFSPENIAKLTAVLSNKDNIAKLTAQATASVDKPHSDVAKPSQEPVAPPTGKVDVTPPVADKHVFIDMINADKVVDAKINSIEITPEHSNGKILAMSDADVHGQQLTGNTKAIYEDLMVTVADKLNARETADGSIAESRFKDDKLLAMAAGLDGDKTTLSKAELASLMASIDSQVDGKDLKLDHVIKEGEFKAAAANIDATKAKAEAVFAATYTDVATRQNAADVRATAFEENLMTGPTSDAPEVVPAAKVAVATAVKDKAISATLLESLATQLPVGEWAQVQSKRADAGLPPQQEMGRLLEHSASGSIETNHNGVLEVGELVAALNSNQNDFTPKKPEDKDFAKLLKDNGIERADNGKGSYQVIEKNEAGSPNGVGDASKKLVVSK